MVQSLVALSLLLALEGSSAAVSSNLRGIKARSTDSCIVEYGQCLGPNDDNTNACCSGLYCEVTSPDYYGQCLSGSAGDDTPSTGDDTPSTGDDTPSSGDDSAPSPTAVVVTTQADLTANLKSDTTIELGADITLAESAITIDGPTGLTICGAGKYTLSGAGSEHVFIIKSGQVRIQNMTVADGTTTVNGGGFDISGGDITLFNVAVVNNTAPLGMGGGLYMTNGQLSVVASTFSGNQANYGGGFYFSGATMTMANSDVSSNVATSFGGGARVSGGTVSVTSSTFRSNAAKGYSNSGGGGLQMDSGTVTMDSCVVAENSATDKGGGVLLTSEWPTLNVINYAFSANIAASGADVFKDGSKGLHMYSNCAANSYNDGPSSGGSDLQCEYYTGTGNAACSTTFPASLMDSACQTCANGTYGCCGRISSTCATTEPTCSADQDAVCP